jgi:predicted amidohydrolase
VASADVTGTSGNLVSYGCTAIVTPEGSVVARVPELQEGVAVYDVPSC